MNNRLGIVILVVNLIVMLLIGYLGYTVMDTLYLTIAETDRKVELYRTVSEQQTDDMKKTLVDSVRMTLEIDKAQLDADRAQTNAITNLDNNVASLKETLHPLAVADINKIKEANLVIVNLLKGMGGRGTYKNKESRLYSISRTFSR